MGNEYFAGFFDADGSIGIDGSTCYGTVSQVETSVLDLFYQRFGGFYQGPYYSHPNSRPLTRWTVKANKARDLLESIYPFLVVKKERCEVALEYFGWCSGANDLRKNKNADKKIVLAGRDSCRVRIKELNQRGL